MRQVIIACLLFSTPLTAAISHKIDTTRILCCRFSAQHHNRILIDNGRIKKIIFPEEKLYVRMEETSGQVFIQAKHQLQEKILVSVISQEGLVQDLEIEFADHPSQIVVLKESGCEAKEPIVPMSSRTGEIKTTIEAILHGKAPMGYVSMPIISSKCRIKNGVNATLVGYFQGGSENLFTYQISNTSMWKKRVSEKALARPRSSWVFLEKMKLAPKETMLAIIAVNA